jgi:hypothetical protein
MIPDLSYLSGEVYERNIYVTYKTISVTTNVTNDRKKGKNIFVVDWSASFVENSPGISMILDETRTKTRSSTEPLIHAIKAQRLFIPISLKLILFGCNTWFCIILY